MDPITIITTVGTVLGACKTVADELIAFYDNFQSAQATLKALANECNITIIVLGHSERLLKQHPSLFTADGGRQTVDRLFSEAVEGVHSSIRDLKAEIASVRGAGAGFRGGVQYAFNEGNFKTIHQQLNSRRQPIDLVVNSMQTQLLSQIHLHMSAGAALPSPPSLSPPLIQYGGMSPSTPVTSPGFSVPLARRPKGRKIRPKPLMKAIEARDTAELQKLLEDGTDPDARFPPPEMFAPLHLAAKIGHSQIVRLLITYGADINAVTHDSNDTPLIKALTCKQADAAITLMDAGADISIKRTDGWTALMLAVHHGLDSCVDRLLVKGADIHARHAEGSTALTIGLTKENPDLSIIRTLLGHGADPNAVSKDGYTCVELAVKFGSNSALALLLSMGADADAHGSKRSVTASKPSMPLAVALTHHNIEGAKILISAGADVNSVGRGYYSPFMYAVGWGDVDVVKLAISHGASVKAADKDGDSIIHWAAIRKDDRPEMMAALRRHGVDIETESPGRGTALLAAVKHGNLRIASYLVGAGARVDVVGPDKLTPLYWAVENGNPALCKLLVDGGADVTRRHEGGWSPMGLSIKKDMVKITRILADSPGYFDPNNPAASTSGGGAGHTHINTAAYKGNVPIMRLLSSRGARLADDETTVLHSAVHGGVLAMAFALGLGADLDARDNRGVTPLMMAATEKGLTTVRWLLEMGADTSISAPKFRVKNVEFHGTAAEMADQRGAKDVAKLIRDFGGSSAPTSYSKWKLVREQ